MPAHDPYHSRIGSQWESAPRHEAVVSDALGPLTTDEVWNYASDGFLFVQELFSSDEIERLLDESAKLAVDWPEDRPGLVREPNSDEIRSLFRIHRHSETFRQLFADERLLGRVRQLLGSDVYIHQSRVNYKPAMNGRDFFWHSDFETWHVEDGMPRMRAISASVFLTESNEFNGPLMLIPGSHETYIRCVGETPELHYEQSLRHQQFGVPGGDALVSLIGDREIVAPKGPAGSVLLFDCNTMHGSNGNLTPDPRVTVFGVYNSVDNQLQEPYCGLSRRPTFLAERDVDILPQ